jgi:LysM repeat protein
VNPYFSTLILRNGRPIPSGYKVRVPKGDGEKVLAMVSKPEILKSQPVISKSGFYKVLPGDTLSGIGTEFGVSVRKILEANGMNMNSVLRPGQKLVIPQGDTK